MGSMRDRSLQLLRRGYDFTRWLSGGDTTAPLTTRLAGRQATIIEGLDAARFFYTEPLLSRRGAAPPIPALTLFGPGAVHATDGHEHLHRKAQFVDLLDEDAARDIALRAREHWDQRVAELGDVPDVFSLACEVLFTSVREWAGISPSAVSVPAGTAQLVAMIDGFGSAGRRQLRAARARLAAQRWARAEIRRARKTGEDTPLGHIARWTEHDGRPFPVSRAAVELLNVLRPTLAVAWFLAAAAESFVTWPEHRQALRTGAVSEWSYAHELRRYYPFAPLLAARPRRDLAFQGQVVPRGSRLVLDIWRHLNDPRIWDEPERFWPERFSYQAPGEYNLIPQGGGDKRQGHRCPGEDLTVELLAVLAPRLASAAVLEGYGPSMRTAQGRMPPRPYRASLHSA